MKKGVQKKVQQAAVLAGVPDLPKAYQEWLLRFKRVLLAYRSGYIQPKDYAAYQLYLLDFGQFNANFILAELDQLEYPYPPFGTKHRHTYIRSTDTVATEMLRAEFCAQGTNEKKYPVFLDSALFWRELQRYCKVIAIQGDVQQQSNAAQHFLPLIIGATPENPVWIEFDEDNVEKNAIHNLIKIAFFNDCMEKNGVAVSLRDLFKKIYIDNLGAKKIKVDDNDILALQGMFPNPGKNKITLSAFMGDIQQWCIVRLSASIKLTNKTVLYFSKTRFENIETLVFHDCKKIPEPANSVMGNLGYRLDPIRASRIMLSLYPNLFLDEKSTDAFFKVFFRTPMVTELKDKKRQDAQAQLALRETVMSLIGQNNLTPIGDNPDFTNNLNFLREHPFPPTSPFILYAEFIQRILTDYQQRFSEDRCCRCVLTPEIAQALRVFINATYKKNQLTMAIRAVQSIVEVMLVTVDTSPLSESLPHIIKSDYLAQFPVQSVGLTPYAMRAFVRVFQVLDTEYLQQVPKTYVTNQSYFEWLQNLDRIDTQGKSVVPVYHLQDVKEEAEVIFVEIHPNNVVETRQHQHDIDALLKNIQNSWVKKRRTLVIDVTLNALNDRELLDLLKSAKFAINEGWLNIVLIQSLTKFSQLGLDKRSAGLLVVINNGKHWTKLNAKFNDLNAAEVVDLSNLRYFSLFFSMNDLLKQYVIMVNENVRFVYKEIIAQFRQIETIDQRRFQITMSTDPKACYVALNMNSLLPDLSSGFGYTTGDIERFAEQCVEYLIQPLCAFSGIILSQRMSIGFPTCSVNIVYASLRFTIGIENRETLSRFADVLAYVAFVLNRQRDPILFFESTGGGYTKRIGYFKEKALQFEAMTPGVESRPYEFEYNEPGSQDHFRDENGLYRPFKRRLNFSEGQMRLLREMPNPSPYVRGTISLPYSHEHIYVSVRGFQNELALTNQRIGLNERRMYAACFTQHAVSGQDCYQNVKYVFHDNLDCRQNTVHLSSMQVVGNWNARSVYGPFKISNLAGPAYFLLYQKNVWLYWGNYRFQEHDIYVKEHNNVSSLVDMSLEDREFLVVEGAYEPDRSAQKFMQAYPGERSPDSQFQPMYQDNIEITYLTQENKFLIERDALACQLQGVSVYKRFHGQKCTYLMIDFWREKNPEHARFLTLMIAVFIQTENHLDFIPRNSGYTQFLFNIAYAAIDQLLQLALSRVNEKRSKLLEVLDNHQKTDPLKPYSLVSHSMMKWLAPSSIPYQIDDGQLILDGLAVLNH